MIQIIHVRPKRTRRIDTVVCESNHISHVMQNAWRIKNWFRRR